MESIAKNLLTQRDCDIRELNYWHDAREKHSAQIYTSSQTNERSRLQAQREIAAAEQGRLDAQCENAVSTSPPLTSRKIFSSQIERTFKL